MPLAGFFAIVARRQLDMETEKAGKGPTTVKILGYALLALTISAAPARAAVEQCRFIQAKPEREACYQRQEAELAAKRKPESAPESSSLDSLQQMRREDETLYRTMRGICRGC